MTIREALADCPWTLTKTELKRHVGGSSKVFYEALEALIDKGVVEHNLVGRVEAGITKRRPLWGLATTQADENRPGWNGGVE